MLLTDGSPNDDESLRVYESSILDVSNTEMIPLKAKHRLALEEISDDVLDTLLAHSAPSDPQGTKRRTIGVSDVVVTPQMKRWHAVHTLEIFYRDAFNNQLNNRYQAKCDEYRQLSKDARDKTYQFGIGLALTPIPRAQMPVFSFVAGSFAETIYYVQVTWVAGSGQEGELSEPTTFDAPAESLPVVAAVSPPAVATGFNVYMGLSAETVSLQNSSPVSVGSNFTLSGSGLVSGRGRGCGQAPNIYVTGGAMLRRG